MKKETKKKPHVIMCGFREMKLNGRGQTACFRASPSGDFDSVFFVFGQKFFSRNKRMGGLSSKFQKFDEKKEYVSTLQKSSQTEKKYLTIPPQKKKPLLAAVPRDS